MKNKTNLRRVLSVNSLRPGTFVTVKGHYNEARNVFGFYKAWQSSDDREFTMMFMIAAVEPMFPRRHKKKMNKKNGTYKLYLLPCSNATIIGGDSPKLGPFSILSVTEWRLQLSNLRALE